MNGRSLKIKKGRVGRVGAIAECTFLESVRDRTLSVPVLLAGLMIGGALFTRTLSLGQQAKLLQDFGLAGICFFSDVLVILAVTATLARGVDRGTVFPILTRPVPRGELILGKYGGVLAVVVLNIVAVLAGLHVALFLIGAGGSSGILWAAALSVVEVAVVGSLAVLFSVTCSPVVAMVFAGLMMFIGHATADVRELAARIGEPWAQTIGELFYYTLPNLEIFDVRAAAVHGYPIDSGYLIWAFLYGILYAAVVLWVAIWIFGRRDLA